MSLDIKHNKYVLRKEINYAREGELGIEDRDDSTILMLKSGTEPNEM